MARLQQNQLLRGVVLVVTVLGLLAGVAFLLDFILPSVVRAKDISSIVQSFAASLAIVAAGAYALYKLQIFRTLEPHMTIKHRICHRYLSDSYVHIDATAILHNSSKVKIELRKGLFRLQGVSPISDKEVESLYTDTFEDRRYDNLPWPTLEEGEAAWDEGELVVEPGEFHPETFEFIVSASDYDSVLIYTYFYNPRRSRNAGSAQGWAATTVYDIMERVPWGTPWKKEAALAGQERAS